MNESIRVNRLVWWFSIQFAVMAMGITLAHGQESPKTGINLLGKYPTTLTREETDPAKAREWQFTRDDLFQLSAFHLAVGKDLKIDTGACDLGIGHGTDGAVWAVVIPHDKGTLISSVTTNPETVAHVWLRFHPAQLNRLFPAETVAAARASADFDWMRAIANSKMTSSWQAGGRAMIPPPNNLTVDVDTKGGLRRFFMVDTDVPKAEYASAFEKRAVKPASAITPAMAAEAFDKLWEAYDHDYAMFAIRPEVDWNRLREQYRPKALAATSAYQLAGVFAELLKPLRDLHIWISVAGANVPVFNRPRSANANPAATRVLVGDLHDAGAGVRWAITTNQIGYVVIDAWNGPEVPKKAQESLEQMRNTGGLIVDVRFNGGGGEDWAGEFAGRFLVNNFVYAYSQFRDGAAHTNLTDKFERIAKPRGPWRYDRPVVLLIGQLCMSSTESFVAMMSGDPNLTTMGDHTCGSSGNPRFVDLPGDIRISLPRWIDFLPDGTVLDERGFQPQVPFKPADGAFDGQRDDLLAAALERLQKEPLPVKAIDGPRFGTGAQ